LETLVRRPEEDAGERPKRDREANVSVVSHRKDADGLSSAALVRYFSGAQVFLTDYSDMVATLETVPETEDTYICDLGLNKSTFEGFANQVSRLGRGGRVHYLDHHPLNVEYSDRLKSLGVDLFHSTEECTAMLIYKKFEEKLSSSPAMKIAACCGAITDYMDLQPFAKKTIASFDRQFLLYEATLLSFSIAMIGRDGLESNSHLIQIVKDLANQKLPHEIPDASSYAQEFASHSAALIERVKREGKKMRNFAYFKTKESSTGNVANFLIGAFNTNVGVAFREEEQGFYEISMRASDESKHDLGKIVQGISTKFGTSGGGHPKAAGARIKTTQFEEFLRLLDESLSLPP
jgi:single-stranded DNA-specific DHH superfamily exonuclease